MHRTMSTKIRKQSNNNSNKGKKHTCVHGEWGEQLQR